MKRLLLAGVSVFALIATSPARAADLPTTMPRKAPPIAPAPPFSWTGCYIGGNVGYDWGRKSISDVPSAGYLVTYGNDPNVSLPVDTGGIRVVDNSAAIINSLLHGWSASKATFPQPIYLAALPPRGPVILSTSRLIGSQAPQRASVIPAIAGLVYAKGGAAWADDKYAANYGGYWYDASETRSGWTVGAGLEWPFTTIGRRGLNTISMISGQGTSISPTRQHLTQPSR